MLIGARSAIRLYRGSRAELSHAKLERSAAFRGRSLREERGCGGEVTHNSWRIGERCHATASSASAGVLYPSAE